MARTLEELDVAFDAHVADYETLLAQLQDAKQRLTAVETLATTNETRLSKVIKNLKAMVKRLKPDAVVNPDAFDLWENERIKSRMSVRWLELSEDETDEL